jgi:uncharacterized RDD family membrane protein YckC
MNTKLTHIARTREIVTKDKNSAGEWVEKIFYSKYYETPPYIQVYKRFLYAFIDFLVYTFIYIIFILLAIVFTGAFLGITNNVDALVNSSETDLYIGLVIIFAYFITPFFYYLFFELLFGRTIGHMISGAIILDEYGQKPSLKKIFIRTISRYVPLDFISAFESRAWHDQWSDTLVLHKKKYDEFLLRFEIEGIVL